MCNIVMMTTGTVKQQAYATLTLLSMNMWGSGGRALTHNVWLLYHNIDFCLYMTQE